MKGVYSEQELAEAIKNHTLIKDGTIENCEGMKYDFRLSNRVLKADFNRPLEFSDSASEEANKLVIEPGEVAFVMTKESLELPNNVYCQLSSKRKLSHGGIIILGGFTVDPNYKGKLIFGLYNISARSYPIIPDKKLVAGIFYKLDDDEISDKERIPQPIYDFPDDLVALIKEYKPRDNSAIDKYIESVSVLREELKAVKSQIDSDKSWRDEFKAGLDRNSQQIGEINTAVKKIADNLDKEISERKIENSEIRGKLQISRIWLGILLAIGGGLFTLLVTWLTGLLQL